MKLSLGRECASKMWFMAGTGLEVELRLSLCLTLQTDLLPVIPQPPLRLSLRTWLRRREK